MLNKFSNEQKSPIRRFLFILGAALLISITIMGVLIMFWKDIPLFSNLSQTQRYGFGGIFIVYGILRFIKIVNTDTQ